MLNRCEFIGNLGKDPEVRSTNNGAKVVSFSLAVSERWKDRASGEAKERTTWVPVVIWNEGLGSVAERYLQKGSRCYVAGQFETRKWSDQSGQDRYSTEIVLRFDGKLVLLDRKGEGGSGERDGGSSERGYSRQAKGSYQPRRDEPSGDDLDQEIPF